MAQLVGSNVSIHDVLTFISDLDGLPVSYVQLFLDKLSINLVFFNR